MVPARAESLPLTPVASAVILAALVLAAFNLRPAVTSVGPVLDEIRAGLGMSGLVAGLLTALPGACFVVFGALAPRMVARTFPSRLLWIALSAVALGLAVRPFMPGTALFVLTSCVALGGIGVANIMMPVVVRRAFPDRVGFATGCYSMGLALGAAVAAAVTVPLTNALGGDWRLGLAAWAVPAAVGGSAVDGGRPLDPAACGWSACLGIDRGTTDHPEPHRLGGGDPVRSAVDAGVRHHRLGAADLP